MGFDVVVFVPEAVAAIDTSDPVEIRGWTELQGDSDLDWGVTGPAAKVAEIYSVVEHAGKKRIGGDLSGDFGGDRTDPGYLAHLAVFDVGPAPLGRGGRLLSVPDPFSNPA